MAAYEIIIKADNLKKNKSPISGDGKESDTAEKESVGVGDILKTIKSSIAYKVVKSTATQVVNHEISLVQLRTGSNEMQGRANFVNKHVQSGLGLLGGVALGLATGNLWLTGMAVLNAGISTINGLIGISQNQQRLNLENSLESISLNAQFIRAGANGSRGGR